MVTKLSRNFVRTWFVVRFVHNTFIIYELQIYCSYHITIYHLIDDSASTNS